MKGAGTEDSISPSVSGSCLLLLPYFPPQSHRLFGSLPPPFASSSPHIVCSHQQSMDNPASSCCYP